ncbi:hypothetical protein BH23VER1_BH23VER1_20420 [soil metagenome]
MTSETLTKSPDGLQKSGQNQGAVRENQENFALPVYETRRGDDAYHVEVFLPGVAKDGVEISVDDRILTVTATRKGTVPEGWRPVYQELEKPNYRLKLRRGSDVDDEKVSANVEAGVLELKLPVREAAKPRTIPVS